MSDGCCVNCGEYGNWCRCGESEPQQEQSMCVELEQELAAGRAAATALIGHLTRMNSVNAEIPIVDETGREWLVFVAGKSAVRPVPASLARSAGETWTAFRHRGGHPTQQELLAAQILADEQIDDQEYRDLQDRAAATKAAAPTPQEQLAQRLAARLLRRPEILTELADRLQNDEVVDWHDYVPGPPPNQEPPCSTESSPS